MKKVILACIIAFAISLSSCSQRLAEFTILSSKNIDYSKLPDYKRMNGRVVGQDKAHIILFIPTGAPDTKEALDRAIEAVPGCVALVDVTLERGSFYIPFIYGQSWFTFEGTPLVDPSVAQLETGNNYFIAEVDSEGNMSSKAVSRSEYENFKLKTTNTGE